MKKLLIQIGVAVALLGASAIPAYAQHQNSGFAPDASRTIVSYNDRGRSFYWQPFFREVRHAKKHKRDHRKQHRRVRARHNSWHWRNDDRWDGYYYADHANVHHDQQHAERNFHRRQRHHR